MGLLGLFGRRKQSQPSKPCGPGEATVGCGTQALVNGEPIYAIPPSTEQEWGTRIASASFVPDSSANHFPDELPRRPKMISRLRYRKRKPSLNNLTPTTGSTLSFPSSPPLSSPESTIFTPSQRDTCIASNHVLTRHTPPTPPVSPRRFHRRPLQSNKATPGLRLAVSSPNLSTPSSRESLDPPGALFREIPTLQSPYISPPSPPQHLQSSLTDANPGLQDPLAERFARLRLAHFQLPPPPPPAISPPASYNNLLHPVGELEHMASGSPPMRQQALFENSPPYQNPYRKRGRTQTTNLSLQYGLFVNNPADEDSLFVRDHDRSTNQRRNRSRTRSTRSGRENRLERRRSRSPTRTRSVLFEEDSFNESNEELYPDLTFRAALIESHIRNLQQEEVDRKLAEQLQQEEEDAVILRQFQSEVVGFPAPLPTRYRRARPLRRGIGSAYPAFLQPGTREEPIQLDSDSEDSSNESNQENNDQWVRDLDEAAIYGGPIVVEFESDDDEEEEENALGFQDSDNVLRAIERHNASIVKTRDCAVCGDTIPIADFPSLVNCSHQPETCASCFAGWIASQLQQKGWQNIKCPGSGCRILLRHMDVQQYATREVFERFDAFAMRDALNDDPNFRWCRAPGCKSGQIHISGDQGNICTCIACGHRVCIIHEDTFHDGETCEEYDYRTSGRKERDQRAQEEASVEVIGKLTKKCPGERCAYNIQKNQGCDHMTCSRCGYEFCWLCLCNYNDVRRSGNSAHAKDCRYHSSRLR